MDAYSRVPDCDKVRSSDMIQGENVMQFIHSTACTDQSLSMDNEKCFNGVSLPLHDPHGLLALRVLIRHPKQLPLQLVHLPLQDHISMSLEFDVHQE